MNVKHDFFLPEKILPKGFQYPKSYIDMTSGNIPDLKPWNFFYSYLEFRFNGLKKRYPSRSIIPFARRGDNDDVACFNVNKLSNDPSVIIIHDFASPGWEERGKYRNFLEWLELAKYESTLWKQGRKVIRIY